jgi:hypothetical protein
LRSATETAPTETPAACRTGPRTGGSVLVNKVAVNPVAVPLKLGVVVAEEMGFVLAWRVVALGGT